MDASQLSAPSKFPAYFDFAQHESRNFSPLCFFVHHADGVMSLRKPRGIGHLSIDFFQLNSFMCPGVAEVTFLAKNRVEEQTGGVLIEARRRLSIHLMRKMV